MFQILFPNIIETQCGGKPKIVYLMDAFIKQNSRIQDIVSQDARIRGYKDTRIQGYEDARIQGYKDTRIQGYKDARIQRYNDTKIKG